MVREMRQLLSCVAVLAAVLVLACACSRGADVRDSSPRASAEAPGVMVASSSDMTEASQEVLVSIPFDRELAVEGNVVSDLSLTLDGKELDASSIAASVSADGTALRLRLAPAEGADGPQSGRYFACYQGELSIAAASADGALPHVTGADGAAAVLDGICQLRIPSGMRIKQTAQEDGSTTVKVVQTAQIRCCTWFSVGGREFYMHHHQFAQETPHSCADQFAGDLEAALGESFTASVDGDEVTVACVDGSVEGNFDIEVVEGVAA